MVLNLAFSLGKVEKCWVACYLAVKSLRWIVFNELGMDAAYKSVLLTF